MKSRSVDQEPTNIAIDVENEVQDAQIETKTTYCFDAEGNLQSQSQVPIKVKFVLSITKQISVSHFYFLMFYSSKLYFYF